MVNDEVTKVRVNGDGSTKTVSFAFKYLQDTDLKVYKIATDVTPEVATLQVLNTDYTVAAGSPQGGVVTFTTAQTTDEDAFVKLDAPYTQAVDIPSAGVFREEAIEAGLDKPVLLCQQLREEVSRAIKLPETSLVTSVSFGEPVADRALVWQDDGGGAWTAVSSASNPDDAATYAAAAAASASSASGYASTAATQAGIATTQAGIATAAAESIDPDNIVHLTGNETVAGVKTFSSSPIVPTPTTSTQAANKDYADTKEFLDINVNGTDKTNAACIIKTGTVQVEGGSISTVTMPGTAFSGSTSYQVVATSCEIESGITNGPANLNQLSGGSSFQIKNCGGNVTIFSWIAIGY